MKRFINSTAIALSMGALLLISSCSKEQAPTMGRATTPSASVESKVRKFVAGLPKSEVLNAKMARLVDGTTQDGWSFSDPANNGINYTSSYGVTYSAATNTFYITVNGGVGGGGTVVAGSSSLDMIATYCFSMGDDVFGIDAFGTGAPDNGVSGVIGLSGDLDALQNASNGNDIAEAFHGLAFYLVYDAQSSGTYEVIDWTDDDVDLSDTTAGGTMDRMAFAFVVDIQNGKLYMSKSGTIQVSGGSMEFNGTYFEIGGFEIDPNTGNYDLNDITFREVPGFGAMMCN